MTRGQMTNQQRDDAMQETVLTELVLAYPAQLSLGELRRALLGHPRRFRERDALKRAVRDLGHAGLVHRHGRFVFATRAAVRAHQLRV